MILADSWKSGVCHAAGSVVGNLPVRCLIASETHGASVTDAVMPKQCHVHGVQMISSGWSESTKPIERFDFVPLGKNSRRTPML